MGVCEWLVGFVVGSSFVACVLGVALLHDVWTRGKG